MTSSGKCYGKIKSEGEECRVGWESSSIRQPGHGNVIWEGDAGAEI